MRVARNSAVNAKIKAVNQLKAIIVGADPALRDSLTGLGPNTLIRRCAELPDPAPGVTEAQALHVRMRNLIAQRVPELLEQNGVGPDSAAALLIAAGDNPERIGSEASSGMTTRLRLNRGGDRQANVALYRITLSRLVHEPAPRRGQNPPRDHPLFEALHRPTIVQHHPEPRHRDPNRARTRRLTSIGESG